MRRCTLLLSPALRFQVVSDTASDVYELRLRLGRFLPRAVVVPLAFVRNFVVALVTEGASSGDAVAPQWVLVTRKVDGVLVGRVRAGRDFGDGENLLAAMSKALTELSPDEFLEAWHVSRV